MASTTATALLVEDNALNRALFVEILRHSGYETVIDRTGESALTLALAHRPQVALVDIGLPRRCGLDVVRELRANCTTAGMGIVVISAFATADDERSAFIAGAEAFMTKPIDLFTLQRYLRGYSGAALEPAVA